MIEFIDAVVTDGAVRTPRRSIMVTCRAKFGGDSIFIDSEFPRRRTNAANTKEAITCDFIFLSDFDPDLRSTLQQQTASKAKKLTQTRRRYSAVIWE